MTKTIPARESGWSDEKNHYMDNIYSESTGGFACHRGAILLPIGIKHCKNMEPIVLNHFIDNYEGSVSYLQFRFALGMYEWRKRESGLLLLCPSKCEYRILILLILLKASFIAFVFGCFSFSMGTVPKLCVIFAGVVIIISYLCFDWGRTRRVYRNLPKMPIVVINPARQQIIFRRNMPCVQICNSRLTLNFDDIKKASWEESSKVKNGMHVIHFIPCSESIFNCYVKGMFLHYTENGEEKREMVLCGQRFNSNISEEILKQCHISFYLTKK